MPRARGHASRSARRPRRLAVTARTDTGRENQYALPRRVCVRCAVNNVNLSGGVTSPSVVRGTPQSPRFDFASSPLPSPPCPVRPPRRRGRAGSLRAVLLRTERDGDEDDVDVDVASEGRSRLVPENNCRPRYL